MKKTAAQLAIELKEARAMFDRQFNDFTGNALANPESTADLMTAQQNLDRLMKAYTVQKRKEFKATFVSSVGP